MARATIWMNLEDFMPGEITQSQKDTKCTTAKYGVSKANSGTDRMVTQAHSTIFPAA